MVTAGKDDALGASAPAVAPVAARAAMTGVAALDPFIMIIRIGVERYDYVGWNAGGELIEDVGARSWLERQVLKE